jgi:hypothetical protein
LTPAGRIVTSATLDGVFRFSGAYVREYQAHQTAADAITLRIVPTARFTSDVAATLWADLGGMWDTTSGWRSSLCPGSIRSPRASDF